MTSPVSQQTYTQTSGVASTAPFITIIMNRAPTVNDLHYLVGQRWVNTANNNDEWFLLGFTASAGTISANWILLSAASGSVQFLAGNTGGNVGPNGSGVINVVGDGTTITIAGNSATNTLTASLVTGGVAIETITGDTGGAESPSAGNFNILGTGSITVAGSAHTETVQLTGLTNHNVLVGAGTATITKVAPSSTSGIPLVSNGASADPSFTTAVVAGGGTGIVTTTAYAPICGGTTATGNFQAATTGFTSSGYVLTSNGGSALPSWQNISLNAFQVNIQVFTSSGTYTPTANMVYCIIECVGAGGGGGGTVKAAMNGYIVLGGGGGGGAYSRKFASATTIGASQTVTIGAAGTGGAAGNHNGVAGGTTSVGVICTAPGGSGGTGNSGSDGTAAPGAGGVAGTGDFSVPGQQGVQGTYSNTFTLSSLLATGGNSVYGFGAHAPASLPAAGNNGQNYGGGGSGGGDFNGTSDEGAGAGAAGLVVITEYIS